MSNLGTQLETFLQVAQLGSFRRAADELFVTQAAVTSRIKSLEAWLGFEVFSRHRRGADLTQQGQRFIEYARNAIDTIEQGREVGRRAKTYRAHYRFMSQFLLLENFSLHWVEWMKQQAPDVSLAIDSSHSMIAVKEISTGLLDLAVGYQHKITNGVVFETLFTEKLLLVTSMGAGADWRDNYIPIEWDASFAEQQRRFIGELEDRCHLRTPFVDAARLTLIRQPASAYVVERIARAEINSGQFRVIEEAPVFERPAYVIYPSNPSDPEIQSIALDGLREVAALK